MKYRNVNQEDVIGYLHLTPVKLNDRTMLSAVIVHMLNCLTLQMFHNSDCQFVYFGRKLIFQSFSNTTQFYIHQMLKSTTYISQEYNDEVGAEFENKNLNAHTELNETTMTLSGHI